MISMVISAWRYIWWRIMVIKKKKKGAVAQRPPCDGSEVPAVARIETVVVIFPVLLMRLSRSLILLCGKKENWKYVSIIKIFILTKDHRGQSCWWKHWALSVNFALPPRFNFVAFFSLLFWYSSPQLYWFGSLSLAFSATTVPNLSLTLLKTRTELKGEHVFIWQIKANDVQCLLNV